MGTKKWDKLHEEESKRLCTSRSSLTANTLTDDSDSLFDKDLDEEKTKRIKNN